MKLVIDPIEIPDENPQTIEEAKLKANWHVVYTREELMKNTCLDGKCGSCKCFNLRQNDNVYGKCSLKGQFDYRQRTTPACKKYERRPTYGN